MCAEIGKTACVQMILSGTAAGVIGANLAGFPHTMSLDIGGTSADVAFIRDNSCLGGGEAHRGARLT